MPQIGKLKLKSNLILAPMAGITGLPFRMLNRKFGCELAFTEMINARSLSSDNRKALFMLTTKRGDRPLGTQLVGSEVEYIHKAVEKLHKYKFDVIDFNAACPERKVVRKGEGAFLLKDPKKLKRLLKIIVENANAPVTVKIRTGWDKSSVKAREIALYAEDAGIDALFIHGRTRSQGHSGEVDYRSVKAVKDSLKIPVFGSGDIFSARLARKMLDETGCDGVMVARGALGNPWIFDEIKVFLEDGVIQERPGIDRVIKAMTEHLNSCVAYHGKEGVLIFRKFFAWYTKGLGNVRVLRVKAFTAKTKAEMLGVIKELRPAPECER